MILSWPMFAAQAEAVPSRWAGRARHHARAEGLSTPYCRATFSLHLCLHAAGGGYTRPTWQAVTAGENKLRIRKLCVPGVIALQWGIVSASAEASPARRREAGLCLVFELFKIRSERKNDDLPRRTSFGCSPRSLFWGEEIRNAFKSILGQGLGPSADGRRPERHRQ